MTTELARRDLLTDDDLANIVNFDDAIRALAALNLDAADSMADYGTGFEVVDKEKLIGIPFIILQWAFHQSDLNDDGFVAAHVVTADGRKCIITDGSTGVCAQLRTVTEKREKAGKQNTHGALHVPGGLVRSDYKFTDADGKERPATTYYLSESK